MTSASTAPPSGRTVKRHFTTMTRGAFASSPRRSLPRSSCAPRASGRRDGPPSRRPPAPARRAPPSSSSSSCPCCGEVLDAKQRVKHLSLCAPDALLDDDDDDDDFERCGGDSDIIRQSVLRRHGARSRAYEVCAARFGWDASAGRSRSRKEPSARRVSRALGVPFDVVVRTIRTEVKETPMGLGVSARALEELEILYEDEERGTVAVNKLAGVASTPRNRISDESMASRVVAYWTRKYHNNVPLSSTTPFVVHRLDYETSGVFVVAKTKEAAREVQSAFEERRVRKTYLALCCCSEEQQQQQQQQQQQGTINYPLVKDADDDDTTTTRRAKVRCVTTQSLSAADEAALVAAGAKVMKPTETDWRILQRNESYALIEARPRTGRTHQIRAHLAAVGWPIVGDAAYGGDASSSSRRRLISRHALHAHTLTFMIDDDEETTTTPLGAIPRGVIVAPPPRDFISACAAVGFSVDDIIHSSSS